MYPRLLTPQKHSSFFLFGPRGTGKSTWLKQNYPQATLIDLLDSGLYPRLLAAPETLSRYITNEKEPVIIDEIQRIPELLNEVHRLIESRKLLFILTGSSARKIRKSGVNLLAGRALISNLYPLVAQEMGGDFNLRKALQFGLMPAAVNHPDPKSYLQSYVAAYIREEVMQESLVRNIGAFSRFLEAASFSQAQVLNVAAVAGECQIERKVVENYFTILEDLLIAQRLPVFSKRAKRELIVHKKFFYFDVGVYRTLRPSGPLDTPDEGDGAGLETLFYQHLRALNQYDHKEYEIFYWRTKNKLEIDFVLYGPRGILAFEIKRSANIKKQDLLALTEFKKDYPQANSYLVYGGEHQQTIDGITLLPYEKAIKSMRELL